MQTEHLSSTQATTFQVVTYYQQDSNENTKMLMMLSGLLLELIVCKLPRVE